MSGKKGNGAGNRGSALSDVAGALANEMDTLLSRVQLDDQEPDHSPTEASAPIIKVVDRILQHAVRQGATHVLFLPTPRATICEFGFFGQRREIMQLPKYVHPPLVSRVKIMADLNLAERRVPQSGMFDIVVGGKQMDARVSTMPALNGEVIQIELRSADNLPDLNSFQPFLKEILEKGDGVVICQAKFRSELIHLLHSLANNLATADQRVLLIEERRSGFSAPNVYSTWTNKTYSLEDALRWANDFEFEVVTLGAINQALVQMGYEMFGRILVLGVISPSIEETRARFQKLYGISPQLWRTRTLAILRSGDQGRDIVLTRPVK